MTPSPMSNDEKFEVLELWHRMNDEQKAAALRVLEMFEAENKAEAEAAARSLASMPASQSPDDLAASDAATE